MGRKKTSATLNIFMNGLPVGILKRTSSNMLELIYDDQWLESDMHRPISLSLSLFSKKHRGDTVRYFFDNLLPDNQQILDRIQARYKIGKSDSFEILAEIGRDCIGAIQLTPNSGAIGDIRHITSKPQSDADIADTLRNYRLKPLGMDESEDFRISLAGAQEKTAFLLLEDKWHLPTGSTPTTHIFKQPIGKIEANNIDLSESVENEWLCHLILKAFGLPVANMEMHTFENTKALVVERFDRQWASDDSWIMRLPQEDFCQASGTSPAVKYESDGGPGIKDIMALLQGSSSADNDRYTFMKSVFLFWVLGATDGHAKNFSIFLEPEGRYRLTPLYDIISIYPLMAKKQIHSSKVKMAMSVVGTKKKYIWERIHVNNWIRTADACNFSTEAMHEIIQNVLTSMDNVIEKVQSQLPAAFPAHISEPIFHYMQEIKKKCLNDLVTE
jgi:serine/threonine-protein kinase HipA